MFCAIPNDKLIEALKVYRKTIYLFYKANGYLWAGIAKNGLTIVSYSKYYIANPNNVYPNIWYLETDHYITPIDQEKLE